MSKEYIGLVDRLKKQECPTCGAPFACAKDLPDGDKHLWWECGRQVVASDTGFSVLYDRCMHEAKP